MKTERIEVEATVYEKEVIVDQMLHDVAGATAIPMNDTDYEIIFKDTVGNLITFAINSLWFNSIPDGYKGKLIYNKHKRYNELVGFADIIKEDYNKE